MKTVCFFGIYDPEYSRNRVLIRGFKENGWNVVECRIDPIKISGIRKYIELYKKARSLSHNSFDLVWVAFPAQPVVWLAKIFFKAPCVFDAFVSLYQSNVFDRARYSRVDIRAVRDYFFDWYSLHSANIVVVDTPQHGRYFKEHFGDVAGQIYCVRVGSDPDVFYPSVIAHDGFVIHFHGSYIPLQGIRYILEAAKILKEKNVKVVFRIIGGGQEFLEMQKFIHDNALDNVECIGKVPYAALREYMASADLTLGIFGNLEKTQLVIPNKVFEALFVGRTLITARTRASEDFLEHGANCYLVQPGSGESLAHAIIELKNNPELCKKIAEGAQRLSMALTPKMLVHGLLTQLDADHVL